MDNSQDLRLAAGQQQADVANVPLYEVRPGKKRRFVESKYDDLKSMFDTWATYDQLVAYLAATYKLTIDARWLRRIMRATEKKRAEETTAASATAADTTAPISRAAPIPSTERPSSVDLPRMFRGRPET